MDDKLVIAKEYLIPKIIKELNTNISLKLNEDNIKFIISNFTENEKGVRNLKRCLETIYSKFNLYNLVKNNHEFNDTFFKDFKYDETEGLNEKSIKILLSNFHNNNSNDIPFGMYN